MWWLKKLNTDNTKIEINPKELLAFVLKEAGFLNEMEDFLYDFLNKKTYLTPDLFPTLFKFNYKCFKHFYELIFYFIPKEVK